VHYVTESLNIYCENRAFAAKLEQKTAELFQRMYRQVCNAKGEKAMTDKILEGQDNLSPKSSAGQARGIIERARDARHYDDGWMMSEEKAVSTFVRCTATTKAGKQCKAPAVHGTDPPLCFVHSDRPDIVKKRKAARSIGRPATVNGTPLNAETVEDLKAVCQQTLGNLREQGNTTKRAQA